MKNSKKTSEEIDEERVVQTHSNLSLLDVRPGESTFATGTKNHSTKLDHAFNETPDSLTDSVSLEDSITISENIESDLEEEEEEEEDA